VPVFAPIVADPFASKIVCIDLTMVGRSPSSDTVESVDTERMNPGND